MYDILRCTNVRLSGYVNLAIINVNFVDQDSLEGLLKRIIGFNESVMFLYRPRCTRSFLYPQIKYIYAFGFRFARSSAQDFYLILV